MIGSGIGFSMNKDKLIASVKEEMGYVSENRQCRECKFFSEEEDQFTKSMYNSFCTLIKELLYIPIQRFGKCDKFEKESR